GPKDDTGKRENPDTGGEGNENQDVCASKIADIGPLNTFAGGGVLVRNAAKRDAVERGRVSPNVLVVTDQIIHAIAAIAGQNDPVEIRSIGEFLNIGRPMRAVGDVPLHGYDLP